MREFIPIPHTLSEPGLLPRLDSSEPQAVIENAVIIRIGVAFGGGKHPPRGVIYPCGRMLHEGVRVKPETLSLE